METISRGPGEGARRAEALARLTRRINYERNATMPRGPSEPKLDRMRRFLAELGGPERQLKIVHVAGTKGKGSTATMIASFLTAAGLRTGLFTSPHLDRVEQRLTIDGQPCPTDRFFELLAEVWPVVETMDRQARDVPGAMGPTYFEIITALALLHFARSGTDAVVLEVGLGGRLDSTNVCQSTVSVITSISFDHTQQLGNSLASIAWEKAGILKPGVPVVCGVTGDEAREVIHRVAGERGCRVVQLGSHFDFTYHAPPKIADGEIEAGSIDFADRRAPERSYRQLRIGLLGRHQGANAALAVAVHGELCRLGWPLDESALRAGLAAARLPARIEVISRRPTVIIDAAHNVASIEALLAVLSENFSARRRLVILGTSQDKDAAGMLARLVPCCDELVLTRYQNNPRATDPHRLQSIAAELGQRAEVIELPADAWDFISRQAASDDLVCVTGSFFLASEIRQRIIARSTSGNQCIA